MNTAMNVFRLDVKFKEIRNFENIFEFPIVQKVVNWKIIMIIQIRLIEQQYINILVIYR